MRTWRLLFLPVLLLGLSGCPGEVPNETSAESAPAEGLKRIVILTNGDDPFWDPCEAGAMEAAEEMNIEDRGYTVTFERADFTVKGQLDKLKQYELMPDIAALGVSVYDSSSPALAGQLEKLKDRGIRIVTIDGDVDRDKYRDVRFAYLGTDNDIGGAELGKAAQGLAPDGAKYVTFVGNKGAANAKARIGGFAEGAGEKFTQVESLDDKGDRVKARKNVRDALDRHPEVDMLVGIWAYNAPACVHVVKERDLRDSMKILSFDAAEATIHEMDNGYVDVMVVQNPFNMGYQGVRLLLALLEDDQQVIDQMYPNYESENGDLYDTGLRVVIPDEGSPLKGDMFRDSTEFFRLSEFKDWLNQYGLKSS